MFEKHCMSKVVLMFVVYCDPSEPYEPISEWHGVQKQGNSNVEKDATLLQRMSMLVWMRRSCT